MSRLFKKLVPLAASTAQGVPKGRLPTATLPWRAATLKNQNLSSFSVQQKPSTQTLGHRTFYTSSAAKDPKELERWSGPWLREWGIIMTVFAITGSTTVSVVRPFIQNVLGLKGTLREGPWDFRLAYLSITLPSYSLILLTVGTLFGRQAYFKKVALRMWGRFIPSRFKS